MKTPGIHSTLGGIAALALAVSPSLRAADHGDAPTVGPDQGADIADVYAFLDPVDASNPTGNNDDVILIGTSRGFIVPSEAGNFGLFDPNVRYTFAIENTGDAIPDMLIDVRFSPRTIKAGATTPSQDATISFRGIIPADLKAKGGTFTAPVTQPTLAASPNAQVVTQLTNSTHPASPHFRFFAGEVDDPFFFDIVGFNRFVGKVLAANNTAAAELTRGRDSFAGYNVMGIALQIPATMLRNIKSTTPSTKIGVNFSTARGTVRTFKGENIGTSSFRQVDRMGIPGVNVAFLGYNRKNTYNGSSTLDDAKGMFFNDIKNTLLALGTTLPNITTLASVVGLPSPTNGPAPGTVLTDKKKFGTGDFLRLETNKATAPNTGTGGGSGVAFEDATTQNPSQGFPNGRRLKDDVIDTVLYLVTNGVITDGDNVNASDVSPINVFPFLAPPQQPLPNGGTDSTKN